MTVWVSKITIGMFEVAMLQGATVVVCCLVGVCLKIHSETAQGNLRGTSITDNVTPLTTDYDYDN